MATSGPAKGSTIEPITSNQGNTDIDTLYLYTDIETDNLSGKYLLQIASISSDNQRFNVFINPCKPLALSTTSFLGLYWHQGDLFRDGLRLNSKNIIDALQAFMTWVKRLQKPVVLICHNAFAFDALVLTSKLVYFNIPIPENLLSIADTLPFFRRNIKSPIVTDHKLKTLALHFKIEIERSHDALSDCDTLKSICEAYTNQHNTDLKDIIKDNSRPFTDYISKFQHGTPIPKLHRIRSKAKKARPNTNIVKSKESE